MKDFFSFDDGGKANCPLCQTYPAYPTILPRKIRFFKQSKASRGSKYDRI
ncbi:hypothetical protein N9D38_01225 [Rubripirellula sp.]|nr:hypothetical protein [Rubripirellula sp.]